MIELIIPALVFVAVATVGSAIVTAIRGRRPSIQPRLQGAGGEVSVVAGSDPWLGRAAKGIGEKVSRGRYSMTLREQLAQAGFHDQSAAAIYVGAKLLLLVIGIAAIGALMLLLDLSFAVKIYIAAVLALVLLFIPNVVVSSRRSRNRKEIQRHLPDAIDLLEICVSAGMGIDMAWNAVGDEVRGVSSLLSDEMALTVLEMQLGAPRTDAMRNMSRRTGTDELAAMVALLVQSDRFGTSIAEALRTFATSMREARSQRAEEAAEKMPVRLLFPLVMLLFPVILIVTCGPTAITLYRVINAG